MSNVKATIQNVDEGQTFTVQFNPKEFKLDEKANWKASDEHQKDKPLLTYEKGEPSVLTVDLVFDTTDGGSVYTQFVKPLRALLTADVSKADGQGNQIKRPPYLIFSWGSFTMNCVCEKLSTTFLMFNTSGEPIRAKVQVALKERDKPNHGSSGSSGGGVVLSAGMLAAGGAGSAAYVTQPGDNLSRIASKTKASPQDIALANNITDPADIPAGQRLVIPANSTVAQVLQQQSQRQQRGNWQTGATGGSGPKARGGFFGSVPSAFDETPPVALDYDVRPGGIADQFASFGPMTYESRTDSQVATGSGGTGAALESLDGNLAGAFRSEATPDEGFARAAGQGYGDHDASDGTTGSAGTRTALESLDGNGAGDFRNDATPDEGFARASGQGYGDHGASDGTTGSAGTRTTLESLDGNAAGDFRNDATPDEGFARAGGQGYGGHDASDGSTGTAGTRTSFGEHGDSDTATGSGGVGAGGGYGGKEGGIAGAFRDDATPDEGFARAGGQGYGGQGASDEAGGTAGDGAALGGGGGGGSLAGAFRNESSGGQSGFDRAAAQGYTHGASDEAGGTAGDGAQLGGFRESGDAGGFRDDSKQTAGFDRADAQTFGHAPGSDTATGTGGEGSAGEAGVGGGGGGGGGAAASSEGGGGGGGGAGAQLGGGGGGRGAAAGGGAGKGDFGAAFEAAKDAAEKTKKGE